MKKHHFHKSVKHICKSIDKLSKLISQEDSGSRAKVHNQARVLLLRSLRKLVDKMVIDN